MADRLQPNTTLGAGSSLTSADGAFALAMQGDGNLVVYECLPGRMRPLWASNTAGNPGAWLSMQGDGNLVVYNAGGNALWAAGTHGRPGAWVVMQNDGNLVIYAADGPALWASNTGRVLRMTPFRPDQHGFRFPNAFVNAIATLPGGGKIETYGRCGGMAYAALDYYLAGVPVPRYTTSMFSPQATPPDGHWLADYIYKRLFDSFLTGSALKFPDWTVKSDHETWLYKGVTWWTRNEEFPKLRARIDSGKPAVLGLVDATNLAEVGSKNHQVLAYGYAHYPGTGAMTVWMYDNNSPNQVVTLTSEPGNPHWVASNRAHDPWRGFFVQDYAQVAPPVFTRNPPAPAEPIRYGMTVKLGHIWSGRTLHSHNLTYSHTGSSGQQQVTCFEGADDNDLWRVKGPDGQPDSYRSGLPVQHGEVIRLQHQLTGHNLHSHAGHPSPLTKQQEVTCFGSNGVGDSNDNWRVEVDGGGGWTATKRARLIHVNTNHALHSHAGWSDSRWTAGQQEVTGYAGRDINDWWWLLERR